MYFKKAYSWEETISIDVTIPWTIKVVGANTVNVGVKW